MNTKISWINSGSSYILLRGGEEMVDLHRCLEIDGDNFGILSRGEVRLRESWSAAFWGGVGW